MKNYKAICEYMLTNFSAPIGPMLKAHEAYKALVIEEEKINIGSATTSKEDKEDFSNENPQNTPPMIKEEPITTKESPKKTQEKEEDLF
jgi:hypothetical protein